MATPLASTSTGYGPRNRLVFDGDETKYELWEIKFISHLRLQKLLDTNGELDANKTADIFAELVQLLDDRSLSLIIRDAKNDGKKAVDILRQHYKGSSKPRLIALYTELTTLRMSSDECCTDFIIRAETAATSLKNAGQVISDELLIAMILKGLPTHFNIFSSIIEQRTTTSFSEFKTLLRSFEETEMARTAGDSTDNVFGMKNKIIVCFKCGEKGHKKSMYKKKFFTKTVFQKYKI